MLLPQEIINHCQQYVGCEGCPLTETCHMGKRLVGLGYTNAQYLEGMVKIIKEVNENEQV